MTDIIDRPYLYLITPSQIADLHKFGNDLDAALGAGEVACVQLRLKDAKDEDIIEAAKFLMPIAHRHNVSFIINDRPDLAKQLNTDGVHLGQNDMTIQEARDIIGFDKDIGVTCHDSRHLGFEAGEGGANYVAFGAFYPSETKESNYRPTAEILTLWHEGTEIPCVAVGGITPDNCDILIDAGAHFIAASSSVWNHPDGPKAAVAAFEKKLTKNL